MEKISNIIQNKSYRLFGVSVIKNVVFLLAFFIKAFCVAATLVLLVVMDYKLNMQHPINVIVVYYGLLIAFVIMLGINFCIYAVRRWGFN